MEEDIKILKEQIQFIHDGYNAGIDDKLLVDSAINVLNRLEQLEKENKELYEDNMVYHDLMTRQNKREYRSKFLKEFREEHGACMYPDYDEIYKRYYNIKNNSVPKPKLKKKIEQFKRLSAEIQGYDYECIPKDLKRNDYAVKMLEELLEEDKTNE